MRYIAAFLLSAMSGQEPTKESVKKILGSVGIDCEEDRLNKLFADLKGKSIDEMIEAGQKKLASVPSGAPAAGPAAAAPAAAAEAAKPEAKKEEKKEESESEDDDMGFGLFD
ncbi:hypothetical protein BOX15_Mlig032412g2 [Macrostomum lignano]|uniref:Large ribosomal subunit protein P2 n=1 Tax=Macrostomum lignano TaxID=282301 RepID=A0A267EDL6_9PLAT|nr:hypothetical protein BOX15_Mlig002575g4 [Macrostomum lignano]PAA58958.1 hypothetical protein BOX15_Mlig002575g3 [Macrostomum lignano]PAA82818.1 hypothetical protein BOX15_Mlig032412g2 [Macrostomum lignano]